MERKRWTSEENNILIEEVKRNFDNLSEAFRITSIRLNRSINAVSCHWYQHLSNPESKSYIGGSCFIGVSIEKRYKNRKICTKKSKQVPEPHKKSLWRKLLKLLGIDK